MPAIQTPPILVQPCMVEPVPHGWAFQRVHWLIGPVQYRPIGVLVDGLEEATTGAFSRASRIVASQICELMPTRKYARVRPVAGHGLAELMYPQ